MDISKKDWELFREKLLGWQENYMAGGVSFYQVMPTYHNPTGKKAYIMNMYTAPEYRRQGIAIHTLYERYGFAKMEDEMELI